MTQINQAKRTRLTKTGQPVMGTFIDVHITDSEIDDAGNSGHWETVKVVGKGTHRDGHTLTLVIVEWDDGSRGALYDFPDVVWRACGESS